MYDFEWHEAHGSQTNNSANVIVPLLNSIIEIDSVLDVGCGDGRWLACFKASGASSIRGVDGEWTDQDRLLIPRHCFSVQDLSQSFDLGRRFDLAMSLEVAEHVESEHAARFVNNLTNHSDVVLFGAAIPFQGGFRHINERWQSYWLKLFDAQGYQCFDPLRPQVWLRDDVSVWYRQNMLLYVNRDRQDLISTVGHYVADKNINQMPIDVVHPERYVAIASYAQIAFKPLIRKLPGSITRKLRDVVLRKV
jgi:methyltransferase family protein